MKRETGKWVRKAEDDFRNGVSFKTVTDAEIAAGGW
jgi:hypothetical protein